MDRVEPVQAANVKIRIKAQTFKGQGSSQPVKQIAQLAKMQGQFKQLAESIGNWLKQLKLTDT